MADIDEKFSSLYTAQLFEYLLKFNRATAMTLQFLVNFLNLIGTPRIYKYNSPQSRDAATFLQTDLLTKKACKGSNVKSLGSTDSKKYYSK